MTAGTHAATALTSPGAAHAHRWRPAATAGAAVATGVAMLPAGVGIAGPHLVKGGGLIPTTAGVALLLVGLGLVLRGAVSLVHAVRSWRKALVVAGVLALLGVALQVVAPAVAATHVPRVSLRGAEPSLLGPTAQEVGITTADGVDLAAWYAPSRNGAAVVVLHGAGSTRTSTIDHGRVLAQHGYGVLLLDARGHGRSGGHAMDFGWWGDRDVAAAVTFLIGRPDVHGGRIGALGLSMGGEEAIGAAASDPRLRAVVAEGATGRVSGDDAWLSQRYGWRGWVQERISWLRTATTDLLTAASPPITLRAAAHAAAPRPMLLIAGGARADEVAAARWIQAAAHSSVRVWVAPGSGHTDAIEDHPEAWAAEVLTFFDEALGPRP